MGYKRFWCHQPFPRKNLLSLSTSHIQGTVGGLAHADNYFLVKIQFHKNALKPFHVFVECPKHFVECPLIIL